MNNMKFFQFAMYDNDSYLLKVDKKYRNNYNVCPLCNMICDKRSLITEYVDQLKIKKRKYHLSTTYDGFNVVSQDFKDLYSMYNWKGLVFYPIKKSSGFYLIESTSIISVNDSKRPIIYEHRCQLCNTYLGVYGNIPLYINRQIINKLSLDEFYRTNIEFGYDFEQNYSLLASENIVSKLLENNLIKQQDITEIISC